MSKYACTIINNIVLEVGFSMFLNVLHVCMVASKELINIQRLKQKFYY